MRIVPDVLRRPLRWIGRGLLAAVLLYAAAGFVAIRLGPAPDIADGSVFVVRPGEARPAHVHAVGTGLPVAPAPDPFAAETGRHVVRGALSVHTGRSHDAEGTFAEVARAAGHAGLDFVVLGDHPGSWMDEGASAMAPRRLDGVLLVPGLELVVSERGRTLAVGLDTLLQHWEGGLPSLVRRADSLDAFLSVVHPRSPKARESWKSQEADGVHAWESFDISEMARMRVTDFWAAYRVAAFLGQLAVGHGEGALARMWREGTATPALLSYDSLRARQPVALTGGLNHHPKARIGGILFPRYEPFFRTVVNHVVLEEALSPDPETAEAQLTGALRRGSLFVTLGDAAGAAAFDVHGLDDRGEPVRMGERGRWTPASELHVRLPPADGRPLLLRVVRDGVHDLWLSVRGGQELSIPVAEPGVYRAEVFLPGVALGSRRFDLRPWILSNPLEFYGLDA